MANLPESATKSEKLVATPPRFPPTLMVQQQQMAAASASSSSPSPQLSTPPGPPVFTSPLRPAAVPFRTSPASPQPVAVAFPPPISTTPPSSSSSTLPPSSPPSYSSQNAPFDLSFESIAPLVHFSAHKILKQKKQANVPSMGFGALVSPGREIGQGPQVIQRDSHRCQSCGAYPNPYCNVLPTSGQWQCVVCRNLNGSDGEYVAPSKEELRSFPELSSLVVDYVQTGNRLSGFVPVSDSRTSAPVVLVIDECLDEPHLQHLQSSLHAFVDSLPPTTRIGIVSYGRTVSVYDFCEESTASADVLPGDKSPSEDSLRALIYGTGIYLSPVHATLAVAHTIFSSFRPFKENIPETARDRCLGTAVEVALAIIQGPSADLSRGMVKRPGGKSRLIVCAAGPNTFGPGALPHSFSHPNYAYLEKTATKWMEHLGKEAHRQHTVVDIMCAGTCPVRVPVLQPLSRASGGVLILHDDFGEVFGVNLQRASSRAAGSHGLLEIRVPGDMLISQVVGPGEEAPTDSHENFKNDASVSVQMLSVEETQCFSVFMETKRDIKAEHVFFQFSMQYSNVYTADITRVITVRLPTVDSVSAYLDSVQDDVAAVLIAKRTLLRAKTAPEAVNMRSTIDERVKDISLKFGSPVPKSKLYKFPKELSSLPEHLFHLRRGPLLGNIVGHEDERSVLRNLFLDASFDLSLRMVAPRCLMHREGGTFEELPAYDLAMQSDTAVVLDHGTDIFIWLGAELSAQEINCAAALAACRTLAEELSESRFPAPRILAFKEGTSQARYFVSRLIPAHKDPAYEQEARFPQLRTLNTEQRAKLKSSFIHFDDPSFCEWMRSLKLVPPEPS
ncbi:protein transport protein SEC23 A [Spinacia oleracea]|uniref:Protein transport protein SEC23 n=1 Tax=Spinacia oleracea TaxID=3562 RepID=A0A9R0IE10_SPIOL|nr:protein transport protein SEC23 A [Spinacia oleracea]